MDDKTIQILKDIVGADEPRKSSVSYMLDGYALQRQESVKKVRYRGLFGVFRRLWDGLLSFLFGKEGPN